MTKAAIAATNATATRTSIRLNPRGRLYGPGYEAGCLNWYSER